MGIIRGEKITTWGIWTLATRPKTLPAAAAPVIAGSAVAYLEGNFRPLPALAALLAALLLQIGANLANDVYDYHRGADNQDRLGPLRVTAAGLLQPRQVLSGMWLTFGLAAILGLYLYWVAGWVVLLIGAAAILAAVAYTGGPFPLGYMGLGDAAVFVFFGLAAVTGTYYVQAGVVSLAALWMALPLGLLTVAILVVNNLRDIESDRAAGKQTLAVRLGARGARVEYVLCLAIAYLSLLVGWGLGWLPAWSMLAWITLFPAARLVRMIYTHAGRPLNAALAGTGQLELWFSLMFAAGLVIQRYFGG